MNQIQIFVNECNFLNLVLNDEICLLNEEWNIMKSLTRVNYLKWTADRETAGRNVQCL